MVSKTRIMFPLLTVLGTACHEGPASRLKEPWDFRNEPDSLAGTPMETHYDSLPKADELSRVPWSGDYWPTYHGGITYRWNRPEPAAAEVNAIAEKLMGPFREQKEKYGSPGALSGYQEEIMQMEARERLLAARFTYPLPALPDFLSQLKANPEQIARLSPAEKYDLFYAADGINLPLTEFERQRTRVLDSLPADPTKAQGHKAIIRFAYDQYTDLKGSWFSITDSHTTSAFWFTDDPSAPNPPGLEDQFSYLAPILLDPSHQDPAKLLQAVRRTIVDYEILALIRIKDGALHVQDYKAGPRDKATTGQPERIIIRNMKGDPLLKIPEWEGLCHAWAPATLAYAEPGPVEMTVATPAGELTVPFGSSDIKALLTYHVHLYSEGGGKPDPMPVRFLGGRCNDDFDNILEKIRNKTTLTKDERQRLRRPECKDTNAGAFHVVVANQISRDEGFIIDITRDDEVWNQGVYRFRSNEVLRQTVDDPENPGTAEHVWVETSLTYVVEVPHSWKKPLPDSGLTTVAYRYRLDLNAAGHIIGGEWPDVIDDLPAGLGPVWSDKAAGYERPDFIWSQTIDSEFFHGYFSGLKEIYEKSITRP